VARLYPQLLGSIFVVPYDSQGYGGGIRPCLHTGHALLIYESESESYVTTDGRTLFFNYNFGRTDERAPSRTISCYSPVVTGMFLLIFVSAETCQSVATLWPAYPLQRQRNYRTVAQQWTSALAPLFRLSGVMSQYIKDIRAMVIF
jgi:hypothetical protein